MKIGYVLKKYPRLSETFILNEILGLEDMGHEISIFSLMPCDEARFHADLARVKAAVEYLPAFGSRTVNDALAAFAIAEGAALEALPRALAFIDRLADDKRIAVLVHALLVGRRAKERGIEHLHAHFMTVAAHTAYLAHLFFGIPFSVTAHAKDIYRETVNPRTFGEVARASRAVVTVTEENCRFIAGTFLGDDDSKVRLVYNGLPLAEIAGARSKRDPHLVVGVGRLVEKKGFHVLLDAMSLLKSRGSPAHCLLIGDGEDTAKLRDQCRRLELDDVVVFAGAQPREQVLAAMRRARVLAAPCVVGTDGNKDALPTVLIEALAVGLPSVSTPLNGIPEIVEHKRHGLLVPENDSVGLADAIDKLIGDDQFWLHCSEAGPLRAKERFDREATIRRLVEVFEAPRTAAQRAGVS